MTSEQKLEFGEIPTSHHCCAESHALVGEFERVWTWTVQENVFNFCDMLPW